MKDKILKWLAVNSYMIIFYAFWLYFLIFIFTYSFLPVVFDYLFFILGGLYMGYKLSIFATDYLASNKREIKQNPDKSRITDLN